MEETTKGRKERKIRERERDKKRRSKKFNTLLSGRQKINRSDMEKISSYIFET